MVVRVGQMLFCLRSKTCSRLHSVQSTSNLETLVGSTNPDWQTQLWTELVKQGLNSQAVLLFLENSTLVLTSPSEPPSGKPQSTYPPMLFENVMAFIQTWFYRSLDASEMPFVACWSFVVASGPLRGKPPCWLTPRGSAEPRTLKQGRCPHITCSL